jgi:drug/metabolite transporter (DMT)-like permease
MILLSRGGSAGIGEIGPGRLFGNLLFLGSLLSEAICSVSGKVYAVRYGAVHSMAVMMISAFLVGSAVNFGTIVDTPFAVVSLRAWLSVVGLGLGCSVLAYSIWYSVIRRAPLQQAALSLLLQPVLGSFLGWALLGESIGAGTLAGAGLIGASLLWWQFRS